MEPVRQAVRRCFGAIRAQPACGLELRHDHGSQHISADLRNEIRFLGIRAPRLCVRPRASAALKHYYAKI